MDLLTHLFLPLTVAYVLRPDVFRSPAYLGIGVFGLLSDFDKFLTVPGLLHSLVTIVPICMAILAAELYWRGRLGFAPILVALIGSHLVLDFVDGGPVPLLYPLVEEGVGLQYPARTVFGAPPLGIEIEGPVVSLRTTAPRPSNRTYGFVRGAGVANVLLFVAVYWGLDRDADPAVRPVD